MSETHVQSAVMEQAARRFEDVNRSLDRLLGDLLRNLEPLQHQWVGAGGRSFAEVKAAWTRDQKAINDALAHTAEALRTSGRAYERIDHDAARRMGVVQQAGLTEGGGGISLPL